MNKYIKKFKLYRFLRRRLYAEPRAYNVAQKPTQVTLHNYLEKLAPQDFWLRDFIISRGLLQNCKKKISVFSVFGSKLMIRLNRDDIKIFIARENVHNSQWQSYSQNGLDIPSIDLSLGFDYGNSERYMRFPLWIMWLFPANVTYDDIKKWCDKVNSPNNISFENRKFCALLSSHGGEDREELYRQLSTIDRVDCDGKFLHNNNDLKLKYKDNKLLYLRNYRFNLCPENSSSEGYVTEKLFEAIYAGCIPIYSGNGGHVPEKEILNPHAILYVDLKSDNKDILTRINELQNSADAYLEFVTQPRLQPDAAEKIYAYIQELESRIKKLIDG